MCVRERQRKMLYGDKFSVTYEFVWKLRLLSILRCLNILCAGSDNRR